MYSYRKVTRDVMENIQNKLRLIDTKILAMKRAKENIMYLPKPRPLVSVYTGGRRKNQVVKDWPQVIWYFQKQQFIAHILLLVFSFF